MKQSTTFCLISLFIIFVYISCVESNSKQVNSMITAKSLKDQSSKNLDMATQDKLDTATFGAGCFWCVEAIFQNIEGVHQVFSGYAGGTTENPTYRDVCSGTTGHAEVCHIIFNPEKVSFIDLLEVFWQTHDPTTLNKQGGDVGTQYRSVVFYNNQEQKKLSEEYKDKLNASGAFDKPVVTEIKPLNKFFKAENYHQEYYNLNSNQPYCTFVIQPKLENFKKVFKEKLKKSK